jgi:hypothetical protein
MNLHSVIYQLLNGRNASIAITCNPQAVTLTPGTPIAVPTGWGIDGKLNSVSVLPRDTDNVVLHGTFLGFRKDVTKTI